MSDDAAKARVDLGIDRSWGRAPARRATSTSSRRTSRARSRRTGSAPATREAPPDSPASSAAERRRGPARSGAPSPRPPPALAPGTRSDPPTLPRPRRRSRSVGARCSSQESADSGRLAVKRSTSGLAKRATHLFPERARLERPAVVRRGFAHEVETPPGPRGGRVEEVAVPAERVRAKQPPAGCPILEAAALVVGEEGRVRRPSRQDSLFEAEHEHDPETPSAGPQEVEDADPACDRRARRDRDLLERPRPAPPARRRRRAHPSSSSRTRRMLSSARRSSPAASSSGGRSSPHAATQHARRDRAHARERTAGFAQPVERRDAMTEQPQRLLLDSGRRRHGPPTQPTLDHVDALARNARVRRAKEAVQIRPVALEPGETAEAEQRTAEGGAPETQDVFEHVRHAEGPERCLDRRQPRLDGGAHDRDLLRRDSRRGAGRGSPRPRARAPRATRPPRGSGQPPSSGCGSPSASVNSTRSRCARDGDSYHPCGGSSSIRGPASAARSPAVRSSAANAARAGLVRQRDADVGARRERLDQAPLDAAHVLEAVDQDGSRVPCSEIGRDELCGPPPQGAGGPRCRGARISNR